MSNINIKRAVETIRSNTTVYTPIVEVVVNAIQAIECKGETEGEIKIFVRRSKQQQLDGGLPEIHSFKIWDNGIGFTDENRGAFDTIFTDRKIEEGGKGFGRFTCLKYFEDVDIDSIYLDAGSYKRRTFSMGKENEIVVNERISECEEQETFTLVHLNGLKKGKAVDKKLDTIARNLIEKLLPYFIADNYTCPSITLSEEDGSDSILLNDCVSNKLSAVIDEISTSDGNFILNGIDSNEPFSVRVFKIVYPKNQKSRISLVAHKREVTGSALHRYIPEFTEDFYEKNSSGDIDHNRNYIIKAYVFSPYLDQNVSLERSGFEFPMYKDLSHQGITQFEIEQRVATIAKDAVGPDIKVRQEKKRERVQSYVEDEAPWHKSLIDKIDLSEMPYNPTNEEIEKRLQNMKFMQETQIKMDVKKLLSANTFEDQKGVVLDIVGKISETGKNDLIHYIALRRSIIDIFQRSLESDEGGAYASEGVVHDIIFPRRTDTCSISFEDHNLWIVDERLNFTRYVSSDLPLNGSKSERPDLIAYDQRIVFRGDNEASNPVTIFEFKKPQRDDFVNPSSMEDPVQQIVRYVNDIRDGKYKTPEGRKILVANNTPFYGYVICDFTQKVEKWLEREKNFTPMPDRLGWFQWMSNINLYIEAISWDKVLKDAQMRNKIFFHKLGI